MATTLTRIVVTGGPCAGKTTALSRIETELSNKGYKVFVVPESATELITSGFSPVEVSVFDFQYAIMRKQMEKEDLYSDIAENYRKKFNKNVILLFDRGIMDNKCYMDQNTFVDIIQCFDRSEVELRDYYDGVFHLVTAANGAEEFYTLENNAARSETPELARQLDKKLIGCWTGHNHFRIIDNSTDFERKLNRLMAEIYSLLGEPVPLEIEKKYLIKMPDINLLKEIYQVNKSEIIQTYLKSDNAEIERRIRQRGSCGSYSYYYTEKSGTGLVRTEKEKKITEKAYNKYLMEADTELHQIRKDRYCFVYDNMYIELDIYPFWSEYAIVEVELTGTNKNMNINLPKQFEVIRDVTDEEKFKNHQLARDIPTIY